MAAGERAPITEEAIRCGSPPLLLLNRLFTNILEEGFSDLRLLSRSWKLATVSNAPRNKKCAILGIRWPTGLATKAKRARTCCDLRATPVRSFVWRRRKALRSNARGANARRAGEGSASFGFGQELQGHQGPRSNRGCRGGTRGGQVGAPRGQQGRLLTAGASRR